MRLKFIFILLLIGCNSKERLEVGSKEANFSPTSPQAPVPTPTNLDEIIEQLVEVDNRVGSIEEKLNILPEPAQVDIGFYVAELEIVAQTLQVKLNCALTLALPEVCLMSPVPLIDNFGQSITELLGWTLSSSCTPNGLDIRATLVDPNLIPLSVIPEYEAVIAGDSISFKLFGPDSEICQQELAEVMATQDYVNSAVEEHVEEFHTSSDKKDLCLELGGTFDDVTQTCIPPVFLFSPAKKNCAWSGYTACAAWQSGSIVCSDEKIVAGYERIGCSAGGCEDSTRCEKSRLYCCDYN